MDLVGDFSPKFVELRNSWVNRGLIHQFRWNLEHASSRRAPPSMILVAAWGPGYPGSSCPVFFSVPPIDDGKEPY